jgi:hypothetical protein
MRLSDLDIIDETNHYYTAFCPFHNDVNTPNLKIQKDGEYAGHYKCWACGTYGKLEDLAYNRVKVITRRQKLIPINWNKLNEYYTALSRFDILQPLATTLHIPLWTLIRLGIGYDGENTTYPVRNANNNIIGVMLRTPEGFKKMVTGSCIGLYIPAIELRPSDTTLVICEGMSDTAALLPIHWWTIGMYNCETPLEIIYDYTNKHKPKKVIMFPDGDAPGLKGFKKVAAKLSDITDVIICELPNGYDVRSYLNDKPEEAKKFILGCTHG